ncbi:hypothetical protein D1159_02525 [Pseudoflavonifractor sp. 524-17]|uniref:hypothetical protein n=1 Tax=Pseudoflavonifractor sp. 524-17 TaxID=2304577 RepID=UPI00137B7D65|nr:hypothetical protein [Pseudoflavonifractor sp. 524-17]NCE63483.1 hypothetical protein [Pseudoflavonifractor sp. 524-17]
MPLQPSEVIIGGTAYQAGFYGDLWPSGLSFTGEEYEVDGQTFRRLDWDAFDCVQAPTGGAIYFRGDRFFILDGALYLARYHNQSEHTLSAVEIPAETAAYFIALVEDLPQTP